MEKIPFLQVGYGLFGEGWADLLVRSPHTDLRALVDISPEARDRFQKRFKEHNIPVFASIEEALEKISVQAALIVVPNQFHWKAAEKLLSANLHVLSEKPLADTLENALAIYRAWQQNPKRIYMVSQNYRFKSEIQALRKFLIEGICGEIGYGTYIFHKAWRFGGWRETMAYPLLEDMSIHHFDILRYVLGKEAQVITMKGFNPPWSWFKNQAAATGHILFEGNIWIAYFGSWVSFGRGTSWNGEISFYGNQGTLSLENDLLFFTNREGKKEGLPFQKQETDGRVPVLKEFCSAIFENRSPSLSIEDNIKTFILSYASIESAKKHSSVNVKELLDVIEGR
ncbi:MAG: Gfo/Idh/MocA family protein [Candidatus Caldatribacteriaceae bacterium]